MKIFLTAILLFFSVNSFAKDRLFVASIKPVYDILLAITKDKNNSILLFSPNSLEHNHQLKKSDIINLTKADLIFYADDSLENFLPKIIANYSLKNKSHQLSKVSDLNILQHRNNKKNIDPHFWLNPQNAIKIAGFMQQKICEIDSENCASYKKNYQEFSQQMLKLSKKLEKILNAKGKSGYVFFHDGYQYFEDYFSITPAMVLNENHGGEISIKSLRKFNAINEAGQAKCIFGEVLDEQNAAQKLAQKYQLKLIILDPLGLRIESSDKAFLTMMTTLVDDVAKCN
jgi:zinc transport system substrate-binding protein